MCHEREFDPDWGREREELDEDVEGDDEGDGPPAFASEDTEKDLEVLTDGGDGD